MRDLRLEQVSLNMLGSLNHAELHFSMELGSNKEDNEFDVF